MTVIQRLSHKARTCLVHSAQSKCPLHDQVFSQLTYSFFFRQVFPAYDPEQAAALPEPVVQSKGADQLRFTTRSRVPPIPLRAMQFRAKRSSAAALTDSKAYAWQNLEDQVRSHRHRTGGLKDRERGHFADIKPDVVGLAQPEPGTYAEKLPERPVNVFGAIRYR